MNDLAVGGIMSGIDTNSIVNALVANAKKPLERYQKDIDMATLEKEVYQNVFDELGKLDNAVIKLNLEGTFNTKRASSNKSSVVKATASIDAEIGEYEVEVKQVAENPSFNIEFQMDPTTKFSELFNGFENGIITINNSPIYVSNNDNIKSLIDKINDSGGKLKANFDENEKLLKIESTDPNNKNKIVVGGENDSSNLLNLLNVVEDINTPQEVGNEGKQAIVVVDGKEIESGTNEIKDAIKGITLNIKNVSNSPVKISVENNNDGPINAIADFIVQYNTLVKDLQYRDLSDQEKENLQPLTEEKRKSMTPQEIDDYTKKWKELNENEIIRKSNELSMLYNDLRSAINTPVNVNGVDIKSLQDLGISFVEGNDYRKYPYLLLESTDKNEIVEALKSNTKLTTALDEDPEEVYKFFAYQSDTNQGFTSNIRNIINKYYSTNGIIQNKVKKGGSIDIKIQETTKRMQDAQKMVDEELNRYWKQFSAMEETIGQLQAQSNYLTNALAGQLSSQ
jgi:flagellar hook-associated protein 2